MFAVELALSDIVITAARILIVLTLLFAPWAFGSVEPWSQHTLQVLVGATWVLVAVHALSRRSTVAGPRSIRWAVPFIALAGYVTVQAVNPSFRCQVADGSLFPQSHVAWLPHSVDPTATWEALVMLLTYGALFWTVRQVFADPASVKVLIAILVASGFVMALVMIGHKFSGDHKLLWIMDSKAGGGSAGPFVNRNNYAAYINLLIPVTLALGEHFRSRSPEYNPRVAVSKSEPTYLIYFMAAVMAGSVFLSGSRAGMIICCGLTGAWVIKTVSAFVRRGRQSQSLSLVRLLIPSSLVVLILVAVLASFGLEHIAAQTARTQTILSELAGRGGRMDAYRGTLAMFFDHWLYGSGTGAFSSLFPFYQPAGVEGYWRYAHSDWLQWLAELGVMGAALVFVVLCAASCSVGGFFKQSKSPSLEEDTRCFASHFQFPILLGLAGISLHAWVDFPLHIPGVMTLAVVFLAILLKLFRFSV
ncbi:MAG: O-antigen ligase family protein [Verrucomicrobia bacterium]|nr:O-antigen ligase family protein [Verrucomicrobiota bacterium]